MAQYPPMIIDGCTTIPSLFWMRVRELPDKVALREKDFGIWNEYSWADYGEQARLTGLGLKALGLSRGDICSIASEVNKEWLFADLGVICIGGVTNGSIRDLDACATGFQLLAGKIGPSHAHVHVIEYGCEVNIFSMVVNPGDIIHADRHGAVVIPLYAVKALPAAIDLLTRREAVILEAARATDFDINKLKQATANAVEIH